MHQFLQKIINWIKSHNLFVNCIILIVTFWVARYWYFTQFGLYEDDLTIIPRAMQMSFSELFKFIFDYIFHLYGQGRPFHHSFIYFFSTLGYKIADFNGPYLFGFLIETLNIVLFYFFVVRISDSKTAFLSGLAYTLFPADTTQIFLTHSLGLHPSLTFLLIAIHLYISNKKWLAYLMAMLILFIYETPFLVFIGVPLLKKKWNRNFFREWILHFLIICVILIGVYGLRMYLGEERVTSISIKEIVATSLSHSIIGPVVNLGTYFYRPLQTLMSLNFEIGLVIIISWIIIGIQLMNQLPEESISFSYLLPKKKFWRFWSEELKSRLRVLLAGIVMLICAYPLTFTVPAQSITGRNTRVHSAGVIGAAIIIGVLYILVIELIKKNKRKQLISWVIAGSFALLIGYGFVLQNDYIQGWQAQKRFWRELIPIISDVREDTIVLVEPSVFSYESKQIGANYWNLPRTLNQIFSFPSEWNNPPRVYRLIDGWERNIITNNEEIRVDNLTVVAPPSLYTNAVPANVIFIQVGDIPLRSYDLEIDENVYDLKQQDDVTLSKIRQGFLYPYLINDD